MILISLHTTRTRYNTIVTYLCVQGVVVDILVIDLETCEYKAPPSLARTNAIFFLSECQPCLKNGSLYHIRLL